MPPPPAAEKLVLPATVADNAANVGGPAGELQEAPSEKVTMVLAADDCAQQEPERAKAKIKEVRKGNRACLDCVFEPKNGS